MALSPLLLFVLAAVVAGGIAVFNTMAATKRRERLFAAATARGWTYTAELPQLAEQWNGHPFGEGDNRRARDVLTGPWRGQGFTAFTYSYDTSTTDSKGARHTTTHRFGVVALSLPTWLPTLEVAPESVLHRAWGALGLGTDIELESEDFNRAFRVRADDPKYASDLLPPRAMERLLAAPHQPWRIEGASVLTWEDTPLEPEQIEPHLAALQAVVSAIPVFVWKDHGYDPEAQDRGASEAQPPREAGGQA